MNCSTYLPYLPIRAGSSKTPEMESDIVLLWRGVSDGWLGTFRPEDILSQSFSLGIFTGAVILFVFRHWRISNSFDDLFKNLCTHAALLRSIREYHTVSFTGLPCDTEVQPPLS